MFFLLPSARVLVSDTNKLPPNLRSKRVTPGTLGSTLVPSTTGFTAATVFVAPFEPKIRPNDLIELINAILSFSPFLYFS